MYIEIASALTGIKTLSDLANLAITLKTDAAVTQKAIESQGAIINLQAAIMALQSQNQELLETNEQLKRKLIDVEGWEAEAVKYELAHVGEMGGVAYVLKPEHAATAPKHNLCPTCYDQKRKRILQRAPKTVLSRYALLCPECNTTIPL